MGPALGTTAHNTTGSYSTCDTEPCLLELQFVQKLIICLRLMCCNVLLQGHVGRGIWRLLLRPPYIVTAGADASIKLWHLVPRLPRKFLDVHVSPLKGGNANGPSSNSAAGKSSAGTTLQGSTLQGCMTDNRMDCAVLALPEESSCESLASTAADCGGRIGTVVDGKGDWVRCLEVGSSCTLYAATQRGILYKVSLEEAFTAEERWKPMHCFAEGGPIVSSCLLRPSASMQSSRRGVQSHESAAHCPETQRAMSEVPPIAGLPLPAREAVVQRNSHACDAAYVCVGHMRGWVGVFSANAHQPGNECALESGRMAAQVPLYWWQPHSGTAVLGLFGSSPLPKTCLFTTSLSSSVRWWVLGSTPSSTAGGSISQDSGSASQTNGHTVACPVLLGEAHAPQLSSRKGKGTGKVSAMDVCLERRLWMVGDHDGNVFAFKLPEKVKRYHAIHYISMSAAIAVWEVLLL